ncbi:MAG: phage portal protein family protein [Phocaeicola sp.]|uniref:phage portal protein family protein n=1 Tax=Phocaeicola sp. TaxID=2773926 RepID=UPI003FA14CF8
MANKRRKAEKTNRASAAKEQLVIHQLVVKAPQRKVYDVGNWRTALMAADNGRTKQLYDLLDDIMIDGVLSDAVQKRVDAVTNSELTFQNEDGEEVEEITALMDTVAWEDLLTEILKKKIYGRSGVEITFNDGFKVEPIPAKHINLRNRTILRMDTDETGIPYEGDSQLLILGKDRDFGLLLKAAPYAIYKRGGFGDWSQWVELFGMPQRVGKYNTYDPESRRLLEEAFEKAGSAPYVVIPKEADVETKESGAGSGTSYNEFRQANNEEMLITILGQTMTTVQGEKGARSLGEIHKEVEEGKNRSDLRYVQRVLNQKVLPMLEARGYPVAGGKFIFPKAAEQLTVAEVVQLSDIMEIPQSYLHEKYSIPMPKDGEPVARHATSQAQAEMGENTEEEMINHTDRNFFTRLWDFFVHAPKIGAYNGNAPIRLKDDATMAEKLAARIANGEVKKFDAELFSFISTDLIKGIRNAYRRSISNADERFAYGLKDDAFITAMEMNLFHFSAGKTLAEIQALNKAFRESGNFQEFTGKAERICGKFNKVWQKTEYDTAVLTAESAANYHRLMGKTKLFPYWKYVTAGDEKVRKEHQQLDGVILHSSNPRWNKIWPPNGWRCRCRVVPLMKHEAKEVDFSAMESMVDDYFKTKEWKMNEAQGWDSNRGITAEVFSKDQQYVRKFADKAAALLGDLHYNDYGLDSFKKLLEAATTEVPTFTGDPDEWHQTHQAMEDYQGRKVQLLEDVFERHTSKKYEKARIPLLECIPDVLKNPDEIWLNNYQKKFKNLNFIKFYKGKAINVICEVKEGIVYQVLTWFEIEQHPNIKERSRRNRQIDPVWRYRRGLLIHKS